MNGRQLTGRTRSHLVELATPACVLHRSAAEPFLAMRAAAARDGFDLLAASSFRDFARQRSIWNEKFSGRRAVLDRRGRPVDISALTAAARVRSILLWSALPGASRHHWGTDLDVVDGVALKAGYRARLVPTEYRRGGPFAALAGWLDAHMRRYGFYRPYASQGNGIQPEPWHLSYAPVARRATGELTIGILEAAIRGNGVLGEEAILERLEDIHARQVRSVDAPPRMRSRWARLRSR